MFAYRAFGVDGVSLRAFVIKLKMTTTKHSKIGPNMAPCQPIRNMPPAIDRPVKYACPPLTNPRKTAPFCTNDSSINMDGEYSFYLCHTILTRWHQHRWPDRRTLSERWRGWQPRWCQAQNDLGSAKGPKMLAGYTNMCPKMAQLPKCRQKLSITTRHQNNADVVNWTK